MVRVAMFLVPALLLAACQHAGNAGAGERAGPFTLVEGELRITPDDTLFVRCGSLARMHVAGVGLHELARRYQALDPPAGQWVRTWCTGTVQTTPQGDSILVAHAYSHMDPDVQCPPVPVDSLAGEYRVEGPVAGGVHQERVLFFPGGKALIISSAPGLYDEVEGRWGLDNDGDPVFTEQHGKFTLQYYFEDGLLIRVLARSGAGLVYEHLGPADPMAGAWGQTTRWLSRLATTAGHAIDPGQLQPSTPIDSIFPDEAARDRFIRQATDTLALTEGSARALATVRDVFLRKRERLRIVPR